MYNYFKIAVQIFRELRQHATDATAILENRREILN